MSLEGNYSLHFDREKKKNNKQYITTVQGR